MASLIIHGQQCKVRILPIQLGHAMSYCGIINIINIENAMRYSVLATIGRYDFGLFWNFNTGKQILPCVIETKRFGLIWGHVGGV